MHSRALSIAVASLAALSAVSGGVAHPTPASVPVRWELQFKPGELRIFRDDVDHKVYWYITYMVTNRTGREQIWAPSFTLFTDRGEILASGRGVPARVTNAIRDLQANELLETQNEIIGEIHHGREHAREGLAVWPAARLEVNELSVFVAGISGETATFPHPISGDLVLLRKTLQRDYLVSGDVMPRGSTPAPLIRQSWVMR